jgi:RNA polymerase sigma-70 factor, ECF subfamily
MEVTMKKVNLREFYPSLYTKDTYVFLPDDVVTALWEETKRERAGYAKIRYHRAYYSLDREDGIERFALHSPMLPEEIMQQKELREFLYSIIMELPEKQLKRFYAYYVLRMKLKDIARIEGTDAAAVLRSVQKAEKTIRKKIKNFLED